MPMRNPPHPGIGLGHDLVELGLSVAKAAQGLGITRQQLYRVIRGESGISAEMAIRLEKAVGGRAEGWLKLQMAYDLSQVRLREPEICVGINRPDMISPLA